MKRARSIGPFFASMMLWSDFTIAADDDKAACLDAASRGQTLRDGDELIEAREQFRICARAVCPAVVQKDCASWLDAVEKSLPTIVVSAKDAAGNDIVDVKLSVDGHLLTSTLDGHAVPMNPGTHTFHFATNDGTTLDRQVVVKEGVTDQSVEVVLQKATPVVVVVAHHDEPVPPAAHHDFNAWRVGGYAVGGVGAAALGVGVVFGVLAITDKSAAHCDANGFCDPGPLADARTAATVSTIDLVAGGVFLAAGVALVLLAPHAHATKAVAFGRGGGIALVW